MDNFDADIQLVIPMMKVESQISMIYEENVQFNNPQNMMRSRLSSGEDPYRGGGMYMDEEAHNDMLLSKAGVDENMKIVEKYDEEDQQTDSKLLSDQEEEKTGVNFDLNMEFNHNKFDLNEANQVQSDYYEEEGDLLDQINHDVKGIKPLSKQESMYTVSSGNKSNQSMSGTSSQNKSQTKPSFSSQTKKDEKVRIAKKESQEEFGARSGRSNQRYQKVTKNKFKEVIDEK